ncbi:ankyrin repeat and SAM domain-containing protein 3 isoform X2 [Petromyzon marinus]|uniref:Ankyrin repeat and SAM domain-containing protein 3 isoform X2 n=1 Tax=Petromyzon marinus TaxID=7757 RepID=A0AAJ7UC97_PETMA|nr:ankyrin repeat and SAM domain-containing protein 3 isoform X2 [Petromyzon marinus]
MFGDSGGDHSAHRDPPVCEPSDASGGRQQSPPRQSPPPQSPPPQSPPQQSPPQQSPPPQSPPPQSPPQQSPPPQSPPPQSPPQQSPPQQSPPPQSPPQQSPPQQSFPPPRLGAAVDESHGQAPARCRPGMAESDEASENELLSRSLSMWHSAGERQRGAEERDEGGGGSEPRPLDLHTAASIGQQDVVSAYIASEAEDLNRRNLGGWTPLMYACYIGHDAVVALLLSAGALVNSANPLGQTPLMLAASCGNESAARLLLQRGADVEAVDKRGWPALLHCTCTGHQHMVRLLLEHGADANVRETIYGHTPLMEAAMAGHEIIVQYLLKKGVRARDADRSGETARSLAMMFGHTKVVGMIDAALVAAPHPRSVRRAPALSVDLSSSDEWSEGSTAGGRRGPSIHDGPQALAQLTRIGTDELEPPPHTARCWWEGGGRRERGSGDDGAQRGPRGKGARGERTFLGTAVETVPSGGERPARLPGLSRDGSLESNEDSDSGTAERQPVENRRNVVGVVGERSARPAGKLTASASGPTAAAAAPRPETAAGKAAAAPAAAPAIAPGRPAVGDGQPGTAARPAAAARGPGPKDLAELLREIGCGKYASVFAQQDVDLRVFLTLTETDLKEVGIGLFGPKRKMASAIARWHGQAGPPSGALEEAYADHLEAEMQEMAMQYHKVSEEATRLRLELLQEQELRRVVEGCLLEGQRRRDGQRILLERSHEASARIRGLVHSLAAVAVDPADGTARPGFTASVRETISHLGEAASDLDGHLQDLRALSEEQT